VLARARHQSVGRFGLRPSPGGFATPAFGEDHAVVRLSAARLVVERGSSTVAVVPVHGSTLRELAGAAGADLTVEFVPGADAPALGDVDEPLAAEHDAAAALGAWFDLGARALDEVLADIAGASRPQLWPEHFDLGCDVPVGPGGGRRCNLGASPGDGFEPSPYLYVGPWGPDRPGDPAFWNAPFGAVLRAADVGDVAAGVAFLRRGVRELS
jgi:hypothetical protein